MTVKHIPEYIPVMIEKYLEGNATPEEKAALDGWYNSVSSTEAEVLSGESEDRMAGRMKERLDEFVKKNKHAASFTWKHFLKVAAAIMGVGFALLCYFFFSPFKEGVRPEEVGITHTRIKDIAPGGSKAILTLADGTTIALDSTSESFVGLQGNTRIIKVRSGQLQYEKENNTQGLKEVLYNSISTPRGGQYQVELADGTNVWLNSASSIRFPTEFTDKVRAVEITGEAYFEVAHNALKPFKVKIKDMYINVLGTEFVVMAYDNENTINTVLVGGSLKVDNGKISKLLNPGDKALVDAAGAVRIQKDADIEEAVAWKNGKFVFNSADMRNIMRQVERWYNVDVIFESEANLHFTGEVSRSVNVSELLRKLELTNEVHFRIEKRKITVLP